VFGTTEINSLFDKTLEFFVAAGGKQTALLQKLRHEMMLLLSSWLQPVLATALKSYSASKASWRHGKICSLMFFITSINIFARLLKWHGLGERKR